MTWRVTSGPYRNVRSFSREKITAAADLPVGQRFNPRSGERGQRRMLGLFGIEEVRGLGERRFEDGACYQQSDRDNRGDCRCTRQMASAAVVASQATRSAKFGRLRTVGFSRVGNTALAIAVSLMRMAVMMMLGMARVRRMSRGGRHAVLTERHCHCAVALQR